MRRVALIDVCNHIAFISGEGNYARVHFIRNEDNDLIVSRTVSDCCQELPDFIRVHRRYAVNPRHVKKVTATGPTQASILVGETELPVSRRRLKEVLEKVWASRNFPQ